MALNITPRIVRKGVATPKPTTPAADLAADLNESAADGSTTVVEVPSSEEAPAPAEAVAEPAAEAKTEVSAALDKAAATDKAAKKMSPLPKKVTINKPKEEKVPEEGERITRDWFFRHFKESLEKFEEMNFEGITLAQARRLFEYLETDIQQVIEKYGIFLFGMQFKHKNQKGSFREPGDTIIYNGPHLEIQARRIFPGIKADLKVENGKIIIGHLNKDGVIEEDKDLAKVVLPKYMEHLQKSVDKLNADDAKAAARSKKITDRLESLKK